MADHIIEIPTYTCKMEGEPKRESVQLGGNTFEQSVLLVCDAIIIAVQRWITDKNCMPPREFGIQLYNCIRLIAMLYEDIDSNLLV